jgi:hypothetical protein
MQLIPFAHQVQYSQDTAEPVVLYLSALFYSMLSLNADALSDGRKPPARLLSCEIM